MLVALMLENIGIRYKRSRLGALLAIAEPLLLVYVFTLLGSLTEARPPFGVSRALFYGTGILPFYLFMHISFRLRNVDFMQRFPRASEFDILLAHVLDELLLKALIMILLFGALFFYGVAEAVPAHPERCVLAVVLLAMLGLAVGMINAVVSSFSPVWSYTYPVLMRLFMALSGILSVVDFMPPALREWAVLNPVTHFVSWFRKGFYELYPTLTLDMEYAILSSAVICAFGFLIENYTKQWRYTRR